MVRSKKIYPDEDYQINKSNEYSFSINKTKIFVVTILSNLDLAF